MISKRSSFRYCAGVLCAFMVLCALALPACGQSMPSSSSSSSASTEADNPYNLVSPGTLSVVTYAENPPMAYEEGNSVTGFDIAVVSEIASRLNLALDVEDEPEDLLVAEVADQNLADCAISSIVPNDAWAQQVLFTDPYYETSLAVIVAKDAKYTNIAELGKRRIGVLRGSYGASWAQATFPEATFTPFQEPSDLLGAVEIGTLDAAVCDNATANYFIKDAKLTCKALAVLPTGRQYSIAVKKDNSVLAEAIDAALAEMEEDGTLASLKQKWLGEESEQSTS